MIQPLILVSLTFAIRSETSERRAAGFSSGSHINRIGSSIPFGRIPNPPAAILEQSHWTKSGATEMRVLSWKRIQYVALSKAVVTVDAIITLPHAARVLRNTWNRTIAPFIKPKPESQPTSLEQPCCIVSGEVTNAVLHEWLCYEVHDIFWLKVFKIVCYAVLEMLIEPKSVQT